MHIQDLKRRIEHMEEVLSKIAEGDFDRKVHVGNYDDALSVLEIGINFMLMDLRVMRQADQEKEARLLQQQQELEARLRTIEEQAASIRELSEARLRTIEEQASSIRELSAPIMEVWDDILVLPLIGSLDKQRSADILSDLLKTISSSRVRSVIIDVTGVGLIDTAAAHYLLNMVRAANLLGASVVLTGVSPSVAQTVVEMGADLSKVRTLRNLKEGLKACLLAATDGTTQSKH